MQCPTVFRIFRNICAPAALLTLLVGCDQLSDVGDQQARPPTAVATVLGHPFTRGSDGSATATVRSQTEVALTGKDSVEGSLGITAFNFAQTDSNPPVPLVVRTVNTVSFAAPAVTQDTVYRFSLTVGDSDGNTSQANITLTVKPVLDPNKFLTYGGLGATYGAPHSTYRLVAAATTSVAPDSGAAVDQTLGEFTIVIRRLLTYTDRSGAIHNDVPLDEEPAGPPLQVAGSWLARSGAAASCDAPENPQFELDIPRLDADDINLLVQTGDRSRQLELSDIDQAQLKLEISITPTGGTLTPQICVFDPDTSSTIVPPAATATVTTAQLEGTASVEQDTLASARAYYETIGEGTSKTTLSEWLSANGFNPSATNYAADAHAVYTNNFDLGFGRDMYLKVICPNATVNVGSCDVASVVINYPSLENAAKKLNAINAVAMEFSPSAAGSRKVVKFYAYAPNPRSETREFTRIHSVNLDGRGERFLPGACTACHGGTPGGLDANGGYAHEGDVNSAFLLWDLDTLLYGDTDTSFSPNPEDTQLKASVTRSAQEGELRKLNAGAYLTFDDQDHPGRFALARELVEGWYQRGTLPVQQLDQVLAGTHNGAFIPAGWQRGVNGNPDASAGSADSSEDIYRIVFAPHCRACHVMHVPDPEVGDVRQAALCDSDPTGDPATGVADQVPIGCYWQFVQAPNLVRRLSEGVMPLARLTMDRLWVNGSGGQTAGDLLTAHLARADVLNQRVITPGTPSAVIKVTPDTGADINSVVSLEADQARFATSFSWTVNRCTQPNTPASCTIPVAVSGQDTAHATLTVSGFGEHRVELRLNGRADAVDTKTFDVVDIAPRSQNQSATLQIGNSAVFGLSQLLQAQGKGNGQLSEHTISVQSASNATTQLGIDAQGVPTITVSPTLVQPGTATVAFQVLDIDGDSCPEQLTGGLCPARTITISATSSIAAQPLARFVNSNSAAANAMNILAGNSYAGRTDLRVEFRRRAGGNVVRNFENTSATAVVNNAQTPTDINYTPPIRVATQDVSGVNVLTPDQFEYRLQRVVNGAVAEVSNFANLDVAIRTSVSFSLDVVGGVFRSGPNCVSCHDPAVNSAASNEIDVSAGNTNLYTDLITKSGTNNGAFVKLDTPQASSIYCTPRLTDPCLHNSGTKFNEQLLQAILTWIQEGANNF
jgi:hypothetical protein